MKKEHTARQRAGRSKKVLEKTHRKTNGRAHSKASRGIAVAHSTCSALPESRASSPAARSGAERSVSRPGMYSSR